jgi:hypothetical protein
VDEDGKRWTEHVLDFEHPERTPPKSQQVFRVPAGEQLPTRMTQKFDLGGGKVGGGKTISWWCEINYPKAGPGDLFALDVPRDAKVVDLRAGDSLKSLLAEFNKQRAMPLEPFTATVLVAMPEWDWKDIFDARRLRFDRAGLNCEQLMLDMRDLRERVYRKEIRVPDTDRPEWWKNELAGVTGRLSHTYEKANEVINNPLEVGYVPLSGFAADGSCTAGTSRLTFNPKPAFGPSDCLMATAENAKTGEKEQVFWFDPNRGHMIVRRENHKRAKPTDWIETTVIDVAEQLPSGRWYVTEYRRGVVKHSGDDLPARMGVAPKGPAVYRVLVEFEK